MELTLTRTDFTDHSTIGELWMDGTRECYTLEDTCRKNGIKIPGATAIPPGRYQVIINQSVRFGRLMPLLLNVPGFDGVRIHSGNTDADTQGCILVGKTKAPNWVGESRFAFQALYPKLAERLNQGSLFINIVGGR